MDRKSRIDVGRLAGWTVLGVFAPITLSALLWLAAFWRPWPVGWAATIFGCFGILLAAAVSGPGLRRGKRKQWRALGLGLMVGGILGTVLALLYAAFLFMAVTSDP